MATETQKMYHADHCRCIGQIDSLDIANADKAAEALFAVVLHARPAGEPSGLDASLETSDSRMVLNIRTPQQARRLAIQPGQADPQTPIFDLME